MKIALPLLTVALLAACDSDETLTAYGAAETTWALQSLNGAPYPATATLTFPEPGRLAGQAPCNSFSGSHSAPYPWFDAGPLATTRRACPDLAAETAFLSALDAMTLAEVQGNTLILSNDTGGELVFRATE
ncbi:MULTISPECIES: META domain-containing protein [unclassified Marinovum]